MAEPAGALVTGGARGIGRAIAERLARRGDTVFIGDLGSTAAATAADLSAGGLAVHAVALDVRDPGSLAAAVASVEEVAPLATMVNNAGVCWIRPLVEVTPQEFDDLMSINLRGVFFGIQAAARAMTGRGGCIVNTASTSAFTASTTPMVPYDTSKGAVRMLTIAAARELAPAGIRVNAVAPGTVDTDLTRSVLDDPEVLAAQAAERIPLGRLGEVTDIAAAVDFLSSPDASYVTGHVLVVDGGWLT